jgi:hypothetical protein
MKPLEVRGDDPKTVIQGIQGVVEIIAKAVDGRDVWLTVDKAALVLIARRFGCSVVPGCFENETKKESL